ncbi:hypothetical protein P105_gp54 [Pelagibacter phage HTVC105P]|nr:hypothetical protein P105_gp54 [Pelagibacter phage HTVC105P]
MLEKNPENEKEDTQSLQINETTKRNTEDKVVKPELGTIIKELPQLLVTHAYKKLKSGEELTASEMKVCLEVCKTYSSEPLEKKEENILDTVPFDDGQKN